MYSIRGPDHTFTILTGGMHMIIIAFGTGGTMNSIVMA